MDIQKTFKAIEESKKGCKVGDIVQAASTVLDGNVLVTDKGHLGEVVSKEGYFPTIRWQQTGRYYDCVLGADFVVIPEAPVQRSSGRYPVPGRSA